MAISTAFHRNVLLLTQVIQPSDEFKKHFRKGMFDKPNTIGFLHISHYLLTIYDSDRFKQLIEWPVICKKSEAKYRNNVRDYLTEISAENPDIGFPNILTSHLVHAGGNKLTIIMWKLSEVAMKKYITREANYNVMFAPQVGTKGDLVKKFFQETNTKINSNILHIHKGISEMESATTIVLEKKKEELNNVVTQIFETEKSVLNLSNEAPVYSSIKKCLRDINDEEVIKMWKANIDNEISHIEKKNTILKSIEQLSSKVSNIVLNNSNDIKVLDGEQMQKINCSEISELFPLDVQCLLFQLYKNDKLVFHNFILLFNSISTQLYRQLEKNAEDISECLLQVETSCKDTKIALNIMETYLSDVTKLILKSRDILHKKSIPQVYDDTALPAMSNVLLTVSPLIKFDTYYNNEEYDIQQRLQLTPVEGAHKSLFARYERLKRSHTSGGSKLRGNLLVPRISLDDTVSTINNEEQPSYTSTIFRRNLLSSKPAQKYSRLFSNRTKRNNGTANSSIMSIPGTSKANSTAIVNTAEEMNDLSDLNLNISTKSFYNISTEFVTPEKLPPKRNKFEHAPEVENIVHDLPNKLNILDICETIEGEIKNDYDNNIVKIEEKQQKRRSIGDLVERYKRLLELGNRVPSPNISSVNE